MCLVCVGFRRGPNLYHDRLFHWLLPLHQVDVSQEEEGDRSLGKNLEIT